jgi:hypothetical protein
VANEASPAALFFEVEIIDIHRLDGNDAERVRPSARLLTLFPDFKVSNDLSNTIRLL